jgi:hypothetical protein
MKLFLLLSLLGATALFAEDDLSMRVREEVLDQHNPVVVNVSMRGITTLQFPSRIDALDGAGFASKPDEAGVFLFTPGASWVSIQAERSAAQSNLNVIIAGKVFPILIRAAEENDYCVIFHFPAQVVSK